MVVNSLGGGGAAAATAAVGWAALSFGGGGGGTVVNCIGAGAQCALCFARSCDSGGIILDSACSVAVHGDVGLSQGRTSSALSEAAHEETELL